MIKEIKAYKAKDGTIHETLFEAAYHNAERALEELIPDIQELHEGQEHYRKLPCKPKDLRLFISEDIANIIDIYLEAVIYCDPESWIEDLERILEQAKLLTYEVEETYTFRKGNIDDITVWPDWLADKYVKGCAGKTRVLYTQGHELRYRDEDGGYKVITPGTTVQVHRNREISISDTIDVGSLHSENGRKE